MAFAYVVRYGLARHVGRFVADSGAFGAGQAVVVRSHRGTELGQVLIAGRAIAPGSPPPATALLLRAAGPEDLERARRLAADRPRRLAACEGVFRDGAWPIDLVDVEPLLDDGRTVLQYLGPHRLDAAGLVALFRAEHGLDIVLEPVGLDADEAADESDDLGCGACGAGGSGCGSCSSSQGGCSGCALPALLAGRRPEVARG